MSISTCQDRKIGKLSIFFLFLSFLVLLSNGISPGIAQGLKHKAIDQGVVVSDVFMAPVRYVTEAMNNIEQLWDMQKTHEMLAEENKRLMQWYQMANQLDAENKALRKLLNMKDPQAVSFQSGEIINDTQTHYSKTLLVRLGEKDGLDKNYGVFNHQGLIGRVIETGDQVSRVLLLNDINSRIPVTIEGTDDRAILAGTNADYALLDHLPEGHKVKAGQKVMTSGHGGVFPYGLTVGETQIDHDGRLRVELYASSTRSSHVQVVDYGVPAGSASRAVASSHSSVLR